MTTPTALDSLVSALRRGADNLGYYPKNTSPYVPQPDKESAWDIFTKSAGIGVQEGARNKRFKRTNRGGYTDYYADDMELANDQNIRRLHLPYSTPFFEQIDNSAYAPHRASGNDELIAKQLKFGGYRDNLAGDAGYLTGRVIGDVIGLGTRSKTWNWHLEDLGGMLAAINIASDENLKAMGINPARVDKEGNPIYNLGIKNAVRVGAATGLSLGAGNWTLNNLEQGGRPDGFEAISASEEDPRESTQPVLDVVVSRGLLGRTARLLPWEQFRLERPDVTYEEYQNYKNYLYNRDPGPINKATFGIVKTNMEGLDGESPEVRVMGYKLTPEGILGAVAGGLAPVAVMRGIQTVRAAR